MGINLKDIEWTRSAFSIPSSLKIDIEELRDRTWSTAKYKTGDTTLGGNIAINAPPQYTRFADLKQERIGDHSKGMGRYYSETIDDHAQLVHMRWGVAKFNNLKNFFSTAYNRDAGSLAKYGTVKESVMFSIGEVLGWIVSLPLKPIFLFTDAAVNAVRFALNIPATKFYYLKPTMPLYWNAVSTMVNTLATNMGFTPDMSAWKDDINKEDVGKLIAGANRMLPDVWRTSGGIDVYAMATRAQRIANAQHEDLKAIVGDANTLDELRRRVRAYAEKDPIIRPRPNKTMTSYLEQWLATSDAQPQEFDAQNLGSDFPKSTGEQVSDPGFWDFVNAERKNGAGWLTFRVDDPGTVSESFSSSTRESDIADKINGISSTARSMRFNLADGNTGFGPLTSIINGVASVFDGIATGIGIQGFSGLAGNGNVDIPQYWDNSTSQLPTHSYTIQLRAEYGNPLSRFQSLLVPLCCLLAGALPLSTGAESFTSPFLCECYYRGHGQTRLGIIESINITRGTGNVGWTKKGEPLGIDITFTIKDLTGTMHMPITAGKTPTPTNVMDWTSIIFAEDSAYNDYMSVLSSLSLTDQTYQLRKLQRNWYNAVADFNQWISPSHMANWAMGTLPGDIITAISMSQARTG